MAPNERPVAAIVGDIVGNVQNIIRSEIRLAKAETADELKRLRQAAIWSGVAAVGAALGLVFVFLALAYALALWLPQWAAALVVGVVVLTGAAVCVGMARRTLKAEPLEHTTRSLKETLTWTKP